MSTEEGDGLGYDVLSFFEDGREKYIEVKSTTQSLQSPFYISNNELNFLKQNLECSFIYRVFVNDDYIDENNFLVLTGKDILEGSELVPQSYMVRRR